MPSTYSNGRLPEGILRRLDSGTPTGRGRHVTTDASAVRWYGLRRDVQRETGVTLHISPGMNAYRDWAEQGVGRANACAAGNCLAAASQGSSSHGGNMAYAFTNWQRVDAMAFDIGDYWRIPWATFKRIAERWGFEVGRITKAIAGIEEPWHIIDRRCYQSLREVEALYSVTLTRGAYGVYRLADIAPARPKEWDEMASKEEIKAAIQEVLNASSEVFSLIPVGDGISVFSLITGKHIKVANTYHLTLLRRARQNNGDDLMLSGELDIVRVYLEGINPPANVTVDVDELAQRLAVLVEGTDPAVIRQTVDDALKAAFQKIADS